MTKYQDEEKETRLQRIENARQKETQKAFVGMKLQTENMRLMEMSKRLGGVKLINGGPESG